MSACAAEKHPGHRRTRGEPAVPHVVRQDLALKDVPAGEADPALHVWRAELDLRPALACVYRALRELPPRPSPDTLQAALRGDGRYPRSPESCARLICVLTELALIEFTAEPPACRVVDADRANLDSSPTYRACSEQLAVIERSLAAELPARTAARAA